ncbi:MAG: preprotein translocase subunit SecB [Gammaproteobacteria bacterium]|nr:preprotein translocase subunit SecB [Gammaproteobacteria bacterium]
MSDALQLAIDALTIEDVSIRSVTAEMADGYDPKFDADAEELDVQLKHVVSSFELLDVGNEEQPVELLRVFIDLGVRWVRPAASDAEEDLDEPSESANKVAAIEAVLIADYSMDHNPGEAALEQFAQQNASFHVWPYWREFVSNQCLRMNLPKLVLPTRQFYRPPEE